MSSPVICPPHADVWENLEDLGDGHEYECPIDQTRYVKVRSEGATRLEVSG